MGTLNTYTHLGFDDAADEMTRIANVVRNGKTNSDTKGFAPFACQNIQKNDGFCQ